MAHTTRLLEGTYRDSVALMQLSSLLAKLSGISRASLVMATASNLALLEQAGILDAPLHASPNDLLIHVEGDSEASVATAVAKAVESLEGRSSGPTLPEGTTITKAALSIDMALTSAPEANLALISVPGDYAGAEAMKALRLGLNVMLFSNNVPLEEEIELKKLARDRDLLLMGSDCGTAIIDGMALGFANQVREGSVGCISASGTGLQQVTCLLHQWGLGISQAIGTGSRDLCEEVEGITMLQGLKILAQDDATKVVVLISKPPHPRVAERVLAEAAKLRKPVVACFIGADPRTIRGKNIHAARTLHEAARVAATLAGGTAPSGLIKSSSASTPAHASEKQRYVRGLYCGGTFCYEASLLLGEAVSPVWSNAPVKAENLLTDAWKSREHSIIDLGDDLFTRGRPHPMIDHRLRNERIVLEASDPGVAVILLDVVLGYGAHPDPVHEMLPSIQAARAVATQHQQDISFVAFLCGTELDPQNLAQQEAALQRAGVILAPSNAEAVQLAISFVRGTPLRTTQ